MNSTDVKDEKDEARSGYGGQVEYWWEIIAGSSRPGRPEVDPQARWYCVSAI